MIEIIKNKDNLKESQITRISQRVKALIINSKNEILLGHSFGEYQFPGGHIENDEDLKEALKRELKEETGLEYDPKNVSLIAMATRYYKDTPKKGENKKSIIYYFEIHDDRIPNLTNTSYTAEELDGKYCLRYIPLDNIEEFLKSHMNSFGDVQGITQEMLELFSYYLVK